MQLFLDVMESVYQMERGKPIGSMPQGERAHPKEIREQVLALYLTGGMDALDTPTLNQLRHVTTFPHLKTCQRWIHLYHSEGHVLPKRDTGNHHSEREINGIDLVNLAIFPFSPPKNI